MSAAILISGLFVTLERTLPALREPGLPAVYFHVIGAHVSSAALLLLPLTVALALLRRRLWDIDPIINRALLYAALFQLELILSSLRDPKPRTAREPATKRGVPVLSAQRSAAVRATLAAATFISWTNAPSSGSSTTRLKKAA